MWRPRAGDERNPQHSGGAGVPPGGTTTPREELADGRVKSPGQKARPGADKTPRWSAERRAPFAKGAHAVRRGDEKDAPRGAPSPRLFEGHGKGRRRTRRRKRIRAMMLVLTVIRQ